MDAYTPLSYGEIRRIHFAKTGSVAAQIRALAERAMDVGEYPNLGRAFAGIIARNEKLKAAYLAETSDQDVVGYRDNDNDDAETEEEEETIHAEAWQEPLVANDDVQRGRRHERSGPRSP